MEIKYQGHKNRKEKAIEIWRKIARDFNGDPANGIKPVPADKLRLRYTNPKTGKSFSRSHIYYVLRKLQEIDEAEK